MVTQEYSLGVKYGFRSYTWPIFNPQNNIRKPIHIFFISVLKMWKPTHIKDQELALSCVVNSKAEASWSKSLQ